MCSWNRFREPRSVFLEKCLIGWWMFWGPVPWSRIECVLPRRVGATWSCCWLPGGSAQTWRWGACQGGLGACVVGPVCRVLEDSALRSGEWGAGSSRSVPGPALFLILAFHWANGWGASPNRESCSLGYCLKTISYLRTKYPFGVEICNDKLLSENEKQSRTLGPGVGQRLFLGTVSQGNFKVMFSVVNSKLLNCYLNSGWTETSWRKALFEHSFSVFEALSLYQTVLER